MKSEKTLEELTIFMRAQVQAWQAELEEGDVKRLVNTGAIQAIELVASYLDGDVEFDIPAAPETETDVEEAQAEETP
ncbi:hypothetical protein OAF54_00095 [bacterium]|nr:hypothetical protein [bacterium]